MNASESAEAQREAVEYAQRMQALADEPGNVHVMGPKLYGPVLVGERECTEAKPWAEEVAPRVVFHPLARTMTAGGRFCPACGEASTGAAPPGKA